MNRIEKEINDSIQEYAKQGLINTDHISDGQNTFKALYEQLFDLEEALNSCADNYIKCRDSKLQTQTDEDKVYS